MNIPIETSELSEIVSRFDLDEAASQRKLTDFADTSRGDDDVRWNFIFEGAFVLKINSASCMSDERLFEISRLISRYNAIGVYCPALIKTRDGDLSILWTHCGKDYICYAEEYAKYPVCQDGEELDRAKTVEHLGVLTSRYTNIDLVKAHSMWSIIDLSMFDTDVDEKQENADMLVSAASEVGYDELSHEVADFNLKMREEILRDFESLPRCVFQGDLNSSNLLCENGNFMGLIDFNLSGTDVNINVFANETNYFPAEDEFDASTVPDMINKMRAAQAELLDAIFRHYVMNETESRLLPCYEKIADLFQYPNVRAMTKWLRDDNRREKCAELIRGIMKT
ncbi:MAG: hypothetical protein LUH43_08195 [Clostridia bacterium]|nr:hypothetical protein [Clostridia bacterium]